VAVAFDAISTNITGWGGGTVDALSHTCSGSNRLLLVWVFFEGSSGSVTGITYNGVALTSVSSVTEGTMERKAELWRLIAPATGANDIEVSYSGSPNNIGVIGLSFTGVDQTTPLNPGGTSGTAGSTVTAGTINGVALTGDYGVWGGVIQYSGFGGPPGSPTVLGTMTTDAMYGSGGGTAIGQHTWAAYGAIAGGGPSTPTLDAANEGTPYEFQSILRVINAEPPAEFNQDPSIDIAVTMQDFQGEGQLNQDPSIGIDVTMQDFQGEGQLNQDPSIDIDVDFKPFTGHLVVPSIFPGGFTLNVPTFRRRFIWPPRSFFRGG
jgi:hypothetical protein